MANLTYRGITYQAVASPEAQATQLYSGQYRGVAMAIPAAKSVGPNRHQQSLVYRGSAYGSSVQFQLVI